MQKIASTFKLVWGFLATYREVYARIEKNAIIHIYVICDNAIDTF